MNPAETLIHSLFIPGNAWNNPATRVAQQSAECLVIVNADGRAKGLCYHHPLCSLYVDKTNGCYYSKVRVASVQHAKAVLLRQSHTGSCCAKHWSEAA